jgi:hypothetical protein
MVGSLEMAKKKKRLSGAARISTKLGSIWCHLSTQGRTFKLRQFRGGIVSIVEIESDDINELIELFLPKSECEKLVPGKNSYAHTEYDVWAEIFEELEAGKFPPESESSQQAKSKSKNRSNHAKTNVPITVLRNFYVLLDDLGVEAQRSLAKFYSDKPLSLENLWNKSSESFSTYQNINAGWNEGNRAKLPDSPETLRNVRATDQFTSYLRKNDSDGKKFGFTFVKREINPRSTRQGLYDNKVPASNSGGGGMDLLLKSTDGEFPVVGEVKVGKDKNAFYALVQAMTYAVELSTPNQLKRVKEHITPHFENLDLEDAKVEIAIILVNPVNDQTLEPVIKLIRNLNRRKSCEGLSKISIKKNSGDTWVNLLALKQ